jgi:hypothetical protein
LDPSGKKFCLGQDDYDKGIRTIEAKLEKECPNYTRMDILYGSRQNVAPSCVLQSGHRLTKVDQQREGVSFHDSESSDDGDDSNGGDDSSSNISDDDDDDGDSVDDDSICDDDGGEKNDKEGDAVEALAALSRSTGGVAPPPAAAVVQPPPAAAVAPPPAAAFVNTTFVNASTVSSISTPSPLQQLSFPPAVEKSKKSSKKKSKKRDESASLPPEMKVLQDKCAETVASASSALDLTAKITELKALQQSNNKGCGKKDFTTTYAEAKSKEIELQRDKFLFEKDNFQLTREDKNNHNVAALRQDTEKAMMVALIQRGCTAAEIKEYMQNLL